MVPLCLVAPAMSLLIAEDAARYLGLMGVLIVRNIASTTAFTGVLLIVSNSSPPEDAGKVRETRIHSHAFCTSDNANFYYIIEVYIL
jgi:hypothetical protein